MSKLSKFLRSDTGSMVTGLALGYAKKQSADVRKVAAVVEPVIATYEAVKDSGSKDPLRDTVYATAQREVFENIGAKMPEQAQLPEHEIRRPGWKSSEFWLSILALVMTTVAPVLIEEFQRVIEASPLSALAPAIVAGAWAISRGLVKKSRNEASAVAAQAPVVIPGASGEAIEWQEPLPPTMYQNDDRERAAQIQAVLEQEAENGDGSA